MGYWSVMVFMRRGLVHLSVATLALTTPGARAAAQTAQQAESAEFDVLVGGRPVGFENVTVTPVTGGGWQISLTGHLIPPIDLVTTKFEMTYDAGWQPQQLVIEGTFKGRLMTMSARFAGTTATVDMTQAGAPSSVTQPIEAGSIVLPTNYFGAYEALAARVGAAGVGARLPIYIAPETTVRATVDHVQPRRFVTADGTLNVRQFDLTFDTKTPMAVEIWVDDHDRLARIAVPSESLAVVRSDLLAVTTREEPIANPGDQDVYIAAPGFNLAATMTVPTGGAATRRPAVILIGSSGPQDRNETIAGVPIFGQLAGALAKAGFIVVRYDKRGTGQSGGRIENATLDTYAGDVVTVVKWLRQRKDVDDDRIAVVGRADGGAVALLAARREGHIHAVVLLGAAGHTGRAVTLAQQQHALAQSQESDADKQAKIALETRMLDAVVTGKGWEGIDASVRRQADTPFFKSWLEFDPASIIKDLKQPILIVEGSLDTEMPPAEADLLEQLSRMRRKAPAAYTRKVVVPGVNHLLIPAKTGEAGEYRTLPDRTISPQVPSAIVDWLDGLWTRTERPTQLEQVGPP
jgi:pimeloyl-ACP methyl ester carboxylesterase